MSAQNRHTYFKVRNDVAELIIFFYLLLAAMLVLTGCEQRRDPEDEKISAFLLGEVNAFRQAGGRCGKDFMPPVGALQWNETLEKAAGNHAGDMYLYKYFDHIGRNGQAPIQRAAMSGYKGNVVGENIGRGTSSAQKVFQGWKNSESHCKNMMDGNYSETGAAYYQGYWVQEFGGNTTFDKEVKPAGLGVVNPSMRGGLFFVKKLAVVLIVALAFVVLHQSGISRAGETTVKKS